MDQPRVFWETQVASTTDPGIDGVVLEISAVPDVASFPRDPGPVRHVASVFRDRHGTLVLAVGATADRQIPFEWLVEEVARFLRPDRAP